MQTDPEAAHSATEQQANGLSGFEQRLLARARDLGCPTGSEIVVGFSGGADSLALAAALGRVAGKVALTVRLAHVDHALRAGSAAEQEQARLLAAQLQLPFHGLRVRGDCQNRHPGVGLEEAARRERYQALSDLVREQGAALLALAHHATDQAETVLLHLLRGAGLVGVAGMAERSTLTLPWWGSREASAALAIWRPLLSEPRHDVRRYTASLARRGLAPVNDPSNDELGPRRNQLRHQALPLLEQIVPGATAALARHGRLVAEDELLLTALAGAARRAATIPSGGLAVSAVARQPLALRRRIVRAWLRDRTGIDAISAERTEAVLGLLQRGEGGRRIDVGGGWVVSGRGDRLDVALDLTR